MSLKIDEQDPIAQVVAILTKLFFDTQDGVTLVQSWNAHDMKKGTSTRFVMICTRDEDLGATLESLKGEMVEPEKR